MMPSRPPEGASLRRLIETIVTRLSDRPAETRVVETPEGAPSPTRSRFPKKIAGV